MAIDQQLATNISVELNLIKVDLQKCAVDGHNLLQFMSNKILEQAQELSLFHLFEAHVVAGKVSEELWTEIAMLLEQVRTAKS